MKYVAVGPKGKILSSVATDISVEKNTAQKTSDRVSVLYNNSRTLQITLPTNNATNSAMTRLFNISGKKLIGKQTNFSNNRANINLPKLTGGTYLISVEVNGNKDYSKFTVLK
jgi:hypothetical protein